MKKIYLLFTLAALLLGFSTTNAETLSPYSVDFNTAINTSAHDFKVAKGWGHIVDSYIDEYYENNYLTYTYSSTGGRTGGTLRASDQTSVGTGYETGAVCDLLVTPKITGTASIWIKKYNNSGTIKFYTVTKSGTTYTKGAEIEVTLPGLSTSEWTEVTIPAQTDAYIGIYASNVYMDDFTAESAEVEAEYGLTIVSNPTLVTPQYPFCDSNNNFLVTFKFRVKNTGDIDLNPGDNNYTVSLIFISTNEVLQTIDIPVAVATGATSDEIEITATVPYEGHSGYKRYELRENITGTQVYAGWIQPIEYVPAIKVYDSSNYFVSSGTSVAYGMISEETTKTFTIKSTGAAPLTISSVILPTGFTTDFTTPVTLNSNETTTLNITLPNTTPGLFSGTAAIQCEDLEDFTLELSGIVLDPNKYFVDFEDNQMPEGTVVGSNWSVSQYDYASNPNKFYATNSRSSEEHKLITPLLKVEEGEQMSIDVARMGVNSESFLKVYYSANRKDWTLVKTITYAELSSAKNSKGNYLLSSFIVSDIPAGNYYIAFGAGYTAIDNIYGFELVPVAHDWMVSTHTIPAQGTVNNAYTATVSLKNINTVAEDAGSYTAHLYMDDKSVATAEAVEMGAGATNNYTFTYTPNKAGTYETYILFKNTADGYVVTTDTVHVTITEEVASDEIQIGEVAGVSNMYTVPVNLYYKYSKSETLYTPDMLADAGLSNGAKITKIYYKGVNEAGEVSADINVWIENTEEETFASPFSARDTDEMTNIYSGVYTVPVIGSASEHAVLFEIILDEPIEYTGGSLRIVATSALTTSYKRVQFEYGEDQTHCYSNKNDNTTIENLTLASGYLPIAYFTVAKDPSIVNGTVTDAETGTNIADATVTLKSGDVVYSAKTDETGTYSIEVIQTDKLYDATVVADGYIDFTEESIDVSTSITKDFVLTAEPITVHIDEYGYAAFSSTRAINFAQTIGLKAYIVTAENGTYVQLNEVTEVPAYTGVILEGEEGDYTLVTVADATAVSGNLLVNTANEAFTIEDSDYGKVYAFGYVDDKGVGFYKASQNYTIDKGKAYLMVNNDDAEEFLMLKKDPVTAIELIPTGSTLDETKPMFNISGQRVDSSYRGIVIQKGKKFVKK